MVAVLLVLLTLMLGGGGTFTVQGVVIFTIGVLWIVSPPRKLFPWGLVIVASIFLLWPLNALMELPQEQWPLWRTRLVEIMGENLMGTKRSPQPWVTWESWLLLVGGGMWIIWCAGQDWPWSRLQALVVLLLSGISVLVILAAVGYFTGLYVGVWEMRTQHAKVFGFFLNRNQTGTVLALAGLFVAALIDMDLRHRRWRWRAPLWAMFYIPILGGMFLTGSRMAVILFFLGTVAWMVITQTQRQHRRWKTNVVLISILLVLVAGFMVFGGRAYDRLVALIMRETELAEDLRLAIFENVLRVSGEFVAWGMGLGQFASVFPQYQDYPLTKYLKLLHPESSWLWAFLEMGVLGVALLLLATAFFLVSSFPNRESEGFALRAAAYVACIGFLVNMIFDVPAHRLGTIMLFGLLVGFAIKNKAWKDAHVIVQWIARIVGAFVLTVGGYFISSSVGLFQFPSSAQAERLKQQIIKDVESKEIEVAQANLKSFLTIQPLNAQMLFMRGQIASMVQDFEVAQNSFRVARLVEPFSVDRAFVEAQIWLHHNPILAVEAWRDLLERGDPERRASYFGLLFSQMRPLGGEALRHLRRIARRHTDIYLRYLMMLNAKDFDSEMQNEIENPEWIVSLKSEQRDELLRYWARLGNPTQLEQFFLNYPTWCHIHRLAYGWMLYRLERYEEAYKALEASIEKPTLPSVTLPPDRESVRKAYYRQPDQFHIAYQYILLLKEEQNLPELIRALERVIRLENAPPYFTYLLGQNLSLVGEYARACKEMLNYYQEISSKKK
ncbi:MAG: O-antigen ligase family protein [Methylacidiphilales bacterium]|nr:O-antigen ligase family protein [Candidatus Methylacidiphilales bacterium]